MKERRRKQWKEALWCHICWTLVMQISFQTIGGWNFELNYNRKTKTSPSHILAYQTKLKRTVRRHMTTRLPASEPKPPHQWHHTPSSSLACSLPYSTLPRPRVWPTTTNNPPHPSNNSFAVDCKKHCLQRLRQQIQYAKVHTGLFGIQVYLCSFTIVGNWNSVPTNLERAIRSTQCIETVLKRFIHTRLGYFIEWEIWF